MAARLTKWTPEIVRKRIATARIVTYLQKHIRGQMEMTATQVRAAEILLRKTLPDQTAMVHSGAIEVTRADELPDGLLSHIAAGGSTGAAIASGSSQESFEVH